MLTSLTRIKGRLRRKKSTPELEAPQVAAGHHRHLRVHDAPPRAHVRHPSRPNRALHAQPQPFPWFQKYWTFSMFSEVLDMISEHWPAAWRCTPSDWLVGRCKHLNTGHGEPGCTAQVKSNCRWQRGDR